MGRRKTSLHAYVDYRSGLMGMTQEQVARAMGISRVTLRSRLYRPDAMTMGEWKQLMLVLKAPDIEKEQVLRDITKGGMK